MRVVLGEQVDMYRTYFLWWEDVMDTAPVTFAPAALQYPDSSASLKEAIVDFPQLPPLLVQVLRYNVDQYLNTQSPIMYEVVIKNHQGFVFLTVGMTSNRAFPQEWPKDYWRPHAASLLKCIYETCNCCTPREIRTGTRTCFRR